MRQLDDGTPFSDEYDDVYYSRQNGLAESRYVFLHGNDLPERWRHQSVYTIAETGFGTGLNFLATWQCWEQDAHRPQQLHYLSIEKHPLSKQQLAGLFDAFPELGPQLEQLLAVWPPAIPGCWRISLAQHRLHLTLLFRDVNEALESMPANTLNCWYLDGFSPNKNPAMWTREVMQAIAQNSSAHATLATFTAASQVRRHLQAAGFTISKRKGFGKKREMITAKLGHPASLPSASPWFARAKSAASSANSITIIGAGIAGCQSAWHLAQRGYQVSVIERHTDIASEASGNQAAIISPKLTAEPDLGEAFYLQCFHYTLRQLEQLSLADDALGLCGVLKLMTSARDQKRWEKLKARALPTELMQCLNPLQASETAGCRIHHPALHFPQGGWINPQAWCQALLAHAGISLMRQTEVLSCERKGEQWQINGADFSHHSDIVIIASGKQLAFPELDFLPVTPVQGQTSELETDTCQTLHCVIDHDGYITPQLPGGKHLIGATWERGYTDTRPSHEADQHNLHQLRQHLPELAEDARVSSSHVAVRITSPDRLPYVGQVPDSNFYRKAYADLDHGRHWKEYPGARYVEGLYLMGAFGARGFTTAALCAESLACLINNEPPPFPGRLRHALHPARLLVKALKKGQPE